MPKTKPTRQQGSDLESYRRMSRSASRMSQLALILGVLAILISVTTSLVLLSGVGAALGSLINNNSTHMQSSTTATTTTPGETLAGIDQPLNATQLSIINNEPDSYFQAAGAMLLNGSITNQVYPTANRVKLITYGNKTSVIYLGSITCIFCGENRWAMALALSRFGNFSVLYTGYSSFGDGDVPTLYWTKVNYNISSDFIGNGYSSPYINFLSIEDTHPITGSFALNTLGQMEANIQGTGNATYEQVFQQILNLSNNKTTAFDGTPYTIWGDEQFSGADAVDFGNSSALAPQPLASMTHAQVLNAFANPTDQFAWTEYAAADVYVAALCQSLSNQTSTGIPACSLPAMKDIEAEYK